MLVPQDAGRLQMYVNKRRTHVYESPTGKLGMSSQTQDIKKVIPPKLNLNELTAPFLRASQQQKIKQGQLSQDSNRKKSPREFELLKVNTFSLPEDMKDRSLETKREG